jgi:hypothetical protein
VVAEPAAAEPLVEAAAPVGAPTTPPWAAERSSALYLLFTFAAGLAPAPLCTAGDAASSR